MSLQFQIKSQAYLTSGYGERALQLFVQLLLLPTKPNLAENSFARFLVIPNVDATANRKKRVFKVRNAAFQRHLGALGSEWK